MKNFFKPFKTTLNKNHIIPLENTENKELNVSTTVQLAEKLYNSLEEKENETKETDEFPTIKANQIKTSVYVTTNGEIKKSFSILEGFNVSLPKNSN